MNDEPNEPPKVEPIILQIDGKTLAEAIMPSIVKAIQEEKPKEEED